jgi:hypothetical protein
MPDQARPSSPVHHAQAPSPGEDEPSRSLSRRGFLTAAGAGAVGIALATAGPAAAQAPTRYPADGHGGPWWSDWAERRDAHRRGLGFLHTMTDAYPDLNTGPRLAQSYADELGLFSTAFVYDTSIAICALVASRRWDDLATARTLGDGLVYAAAHDPVYHDGRLRQAYNVGPYVFYDGNPQPYGFVLPDGTANIGWQFGFLGTAVGDMAWPGIALLQLHAHTRERRYLATAQGIGEWIVARTTSSKPLGGFSFGVNGTDESIPNQSTEHNIDCVAFFTLLHQATGDRRWKDAARRARAFVERMWEPAGGYFYTGTNDGVEINRDPLPLDPQTWSWLALRDRHYGRAIDWALSTLAATDDPSAPVPSSSTSSTSQLPSGVAISGVTFSSASLSSTAQYNSITVHQQGVWLEGTSQLAAAFADRGGRHDRRTSEDLLTQVRGAQAKVGAGQHVGGTELPKAGGVVAASSLLDTGFGFGYFQVQHVGATSWFLMADGASNPFQRGGL